MASEIETLQREVAELREKVSELITEHNLMSSYLEKQRRDLGKHMTYRWYRFIVWLWPLPLPPYERRMVVNRFRARDRRPVVREKAPSRARKPLLPPAESQVL